MPGIQLPIGIDTVNPVPADFKYGPYASTAAAIAAIPQVLRFDGLTVKIIGLGEYWWLAADLTNTGLIPKSGGGLTNPVCDIQMQKTTLPNTLGVPVNFVRTNFGGEVDIITAGITEIARDDNAGSIFNIAVEGGDNLTTSPLNTQWNSVYTDPINNGHGNINNVTTRTYGTFRQALNNNIDLNVLTTPLVMKDLITGKYYLFTFTQYLSLPVPPPAEGYLDISTYPPVNGTVVTIGAELYTYNSALDEWSNPNAGVFTDLNDCINSNPFTDVYTDYGNPIITLIALADGSYYNSIVTTVAPVQAGFAFQNPTLINGTGDYGGDFAYTRTEVIPGGPACTGRITFDDGSWIDTAPGSLPIARYVYLVQDATDVTRLGGSASNIYNTFQAAYNAANILQLALGGSNRVAIMVGNTTAATVGNLTLSANWNNNVVIVGQSQASSILGNIIANAFNIQITFTDITLGNITTTGNNTQLFNCRNSTLSIISSSLPGNINITNCQNLTIAGGILAQNITTGSSSNISCSGCINTTLGGILTTAVDGSAGSISVGSGTNISIGSIQQTNSSVLGNYNMGGFFASNTSGLTVGGIFQTYANAASTGTMSGVFVQATCSDVTFTGGITIVIASGGVSSDVKISNVQIHNAIFPTSSGIRVCVGGSNQFPAVGSGYVEIFLLKNCSLGWGVRVGSNTITPKILSFDILNCEITWNIVVNRQDCGLWVYNSRCSYNVFTLENVRCDATHWGLTIQNTLTTVPFMTSGNSMLFSNVQTAVLVLTIANPVGATNTVDDIKFLNCTTRQAMLLTIAQGNVNFLMENHANAGYYSISSSGAAITKPSVIINSSLNTTTAGLTIPTAASPPFVLKSSFMQYYTNAARTLNITAYSSYIESIAVAATASVFTGTLNTSTIRRLVTENVAGLTLNVSHDQSY